MTSSERAAHYERLAVDAVADAAAPVSTRDLGLLRGGFSPSQADIDSLTAEVTTSRAKLSAIHDEVEQTVDRILRDRIIEILDGPTP